MREFFMELAAAASDATLPLFRDGLVVDNKLAHGFDPVTEADKAAERALRRLIAERFPADGIEGEEYGLERADAPRRWVIDPIDGTRAFICGLPLWGTLVGVLEGGRAEAGMMAQAYTGEIFYGDPSGSVLIHQGVTTPLKVSDCQKLSDAKAMTTAPELWRGESAAPFADLCAQAKLMRYGADCYAFAMLATGAVDLVVECGLKSYDICGLIPVIKGAGGVIAQPDGSRAEGGGTVIAAATPALFSQACALF